MTTEVTRLLHRWRDGDQSALDEMLPLVYKELQRIAQSFLRRQPADHTLQPTALVNEAWIKLFRSDEPDFTDRAHFLAVMSRVMRQVLIDHARAGVAAKRWGHRQRVSLDAGADLAVENMRDIDVLELDEALDALSREDAALAEIIQMHYFGGMTAEEVAIALSRTAHAVRHDIRLARAWLRREIDRQP